MALVSDFDRYFLHLPRISHPENFDTFWQNAINELKKIPIDVQYVHNKRKSTGKFSAYDMTYVGYNKMQLFATLYIPDKITKPRVVILFHDYDDMESYSQFPIDLPFAYCFVELRGHRNIMHFDQEENKYPGFMAEGLLDKDEYYVKGLYLDGLRTIDALRLHNELDCSKIAIIGKGLGSAVAVFTAANSNRVVALVLDTPSFCYLEMAQNIAKSTIANEINSFIEQHRSKKSLIKKNLSYFDTLQFVNQVTCPVLTIVGFKDILSPAECVFALFNHLRCDKTIEVYPEEGHSAGGIEQQKRMVEWIKGIVL
ncbi:MAG: acetylxylan esterase [Spirochaetes bacterium]|nr:acetylxylan esterase [Spirochaetota bacterium]